MACPRWFLDSFKLHCNIAALTNADLAAEKFWQEVHRSFGITGESLPACPACNSVLVPLGPPNMGVSTCARCDTNYVLFDGQPTKLGREFLSNRDVEIIFPNSINPAGETQRGHALSGETSRK